MVPVLEHAPRLQAEHSLYGYGTLSSMPRATLGGDDHCVYAGRARVPTGELADDLAAAISTGQPITRVLTRHGITRNMLRSWVRIGRRQMTSWSDGCAIDNDVFLPCWQLALALAEAHLARSQWSVDLVRQAGPHGAA